MKRRKKIVVPNGDEGLQEAIAKVIASRALNGGFDVMMTKIDNIEEKVDAVHTAIYHQDEGVFARMKSLAVEQSEKTNELEKKVVKDDQHIVKKLDDQGQKLSAVLKWKANLTSGFKWTLVTLAT